VVFYHLITFFRQSTNRDISLRFAQHSLNKEDLVAVLFEIHIDSAIQTVPFASLNGIIVIMHNRIWNIQLKLTSNHDPTLDSLTNFMRKSLIGPNAIQRLASFMFNIHEWDKAKEIFELYPR
jgi:hypothetical protein